MEGEQDSSNPPSQLGGAAAGAGGGTLLIALSDLLPDGHVKHILQLAAPLATVGLSGTWFWTRSKIGAIAADRKRQKLQTRVRKTLNAIINDPRASPEHRENARKKLEEFELAVVQGDLDKIKFLGNL